MKGIGEGQIGIMQVSVKVNMTGSWSVVLGSNPGLAQFCI